MEKKEFNHIQREELKKLYIYIGPHVMNDTLYRVFRTRTASHDFVFYRDDEGVLTLASKEEAWALLKNFAMGGDVVYNQTVVLNQERGETPKRKLGKVES